MSRGLVAWRVLVALARAAAYTVSGWLVLAVVDGWVGVRGGRDVELPAWLYWFTLAAAVLVAAYNEPARWRMVLHPRRSWWPTTGTGSGEHAEGSGHGSDEG